MLNYYSWWKNFSLILLACLGLLYALPNLYGEDPAVQISSNGSYPLPATSQITAILKTAGLTYKHLESTDSSLLIRFYDTDTELKAKDQLKSALGDSDTVTPNLAPATPAWLEAIGARPMKLGLDLRGGVHFTLQIDLNSWLTQRSSGLIKNISDSLREAQIRYAAVIPYAGNKILVGFRSPAEQNQAAQLLSQQFPELAFTPRTSADHNELIGQWSESGLNTLRQQAIEQTMTILRNRINELGVAEPIVQQQGSDRIAVDLPGVQDTARAEQILGGTATLEFRLLDLQNDPQLAQRNGLPPPGSLLYQYQNQPVLLQNNVILTGTSITDAASSYSDDGRPSVNISLGGGGEDYFHRVTGDNIGKPLAIVYVETRTNPEIIAGKTVLVPKKIERVISIATIQSALPSNFQITGLGDPNEARNLALMLRAGALPAPIYIVEERTVGPQLGSENIRRGFTSIAVGLGLAILFMGIYYRNFGLIANLALVLNLILLVALLSLLGMTLTLPGMAGIVLTVGMAVDANVLIFERIREELRNKVPPQTSIHAGYERALTTIIDANVTTLIVALVLFGIGTGAIKGFAVTLTLGLLTSMLTGVLYARAMVNACFGRRSLKTLPIGI